jgi:class I fructose-bisphosphate aldolase
VREGCDRFGMPLVIWAYPRGRDIERKGGRDSFYAIDYSARMAMEMGADVVKLNMPKLDPEKAKNSPAPYNELEVSQEEAIRQCVESAGRSLVVLSGGSKADDEAVLAQTRAVMEAGGSGVIYGRNVWQREWNAAQEIIEQIKEIMLSSVRRIP